MHVYTRVPPPHTHTSEMVTFEKFANNRLAGQSAENVILCHLSDSVPVTALVLFRFPFKSNFFLWTTCILQLIMVGFVLGL